MVLFMISQLIIEKDLKKKIYLIFMNKYKIQGWPKKTPLKFNGHCFNEN